MNAIETFNLNKTYRQGRRTVEAVKKLNLEVPSGVVFGCVGTNGSGKTTTIRMLCGILTPTSGTAWVAGASLSEPEKLKTRIGYAGQGTSIYRDLSVQENLRFMAELFFDSTRAKLAVNTVLERLNLKSIRDVPAKQLSGGWRQRLLIATAIVHKPKIIFLDEPTANLDPVARRELWDVIYELNADGITVFVSTHDMQEAEYCHYVALVSKGEVLALDKPQALRENTPGVFYRFESSAPLEGLNTARQLPEVRDVWLRGHSVRISTNQPLLFQDILGVPLRSVSPDLEDTFVVLMRQKEKSA